jgi:enoyl-CoA hydratase
VDYENILLDIADKLAWIRFNRPDKLNAMNAALIAELDIALRECEADPQVKAVVLTGSDRAFMAGADIQPLAGADVCTADRIAEETMRVQERLVELPKPTIAAIAGFALGGGLEIALCCDFRLAADNAVLGLPEITLGIIPGGGGTQRLPRLVGLGVATEMLLLGTPVNAQQALSIGLVHQVLPLDKLLAGAETLAGKLAEIPSVAMKACKAAMKAGLNTGLKEGLRIEQNAFSMLFGTLDQKEGMAAFLEKRKARFVGK